MLAPLGGDIRVTAADGFERSASANRTQSGHIVSVSMKLGGKSGNASRLPILIN